MVRLNGEKELPAMESINVLFDDLYPPPPEIQNNLLASSQFDPASTNDDFLEKMLSSVPSSTFPWPEDQQSLLVEGSLEEQPRTFTTTNTRQQQVNSFSGDPLSIQQLSRGLDAGNRPIPHSDHQAAVEGATFSSLNLPKGVDASGEGLLNGFPGPFVQNSISSQHFNHPEIVEPPHFDIRECPAAGSIGPSSGGATTQPRQRVRARRGQATDPHSIAERLRRERIAERMKALQELVPKANKTDKASMLDEIIDYVKFLQLQVKVLSLSRLGSGVATNVSSLVEAVHTSHEYDGNSKEMTEEGTAVTEQQVAKLMEEDMGAAMQYLQSKGLCLMPITLAAARASPAAASRR